MLKVEKDNRVPFESREQLQDLLLKIHLMNSYATEQGMEMPAEVADHIAELSSITEPKDASANPPDSPDGPPSQPVAAAIKKAYKVYTELAALIKPVTPESIEASQPRNGLWATITNPRVTDALVVLTIAALAVFIWGAIRLSNDPNSRLGLQLSYLGAALLGSSFAGLYTAFKFISTRTFDPLCTSSYVTRVLLGTVSGLILANFGVYLTNGATAAAKLAPATLGLVGGYSADAVNLILKRVADTLVAAVSGSGDEGNKARQAQLLADAKINDAKTIAELGNYLQKRPTPR